MKYFSVNKEELVGMQTTGEIYSDGEYVNLPDDIEAKTITMGFSVSEYGEDGMIENVAFYPVSTDMESLTNNEDVVLEHIKSIYTPDKWQNHQW
jgi:hypothetical protein